MQRIFPVISWLPLLALVYCRFSVLQGDNSIVRTDFISLTLLNLFLDMLLIFFWGHCHFSASSQCIIKVPLKHVREDKPRLPNMEYPIQFV